VYQLLNYVINKRLKKIVKPANIVEPGQGGGRQGRHQPAKDALHPAGSSETGQESLSSGQ